MLDRRRTARSRLLTQLVRASRSHRAMILLGAVAFRDGYVDLLAAVEASRRRDGPLVVLSDATWQVGSAALAGVARRLAPRRRPGTAEPGFARLARAAIRAIDGPRVVYCVLSSDERREFPERWGVDPDRVVFTPFFATYGPNGATSPGSGEGVFAGGDSLRDYPTLVAACRGLGAEVRIAARRIPADLAAALPENVRGGPEPEPRYLELMRSARVVAVPLRADVERSAGHATYLSAMAMGKPVVVTDAHGVRDHVDDRRTGIVVPPADPAAMHGALRWALDPANADEVAAMGDRARAVVAERYHVGAYAERLLAVVDRFLH